MQELEDELVINVQLAEAFGQHLLRRIGENMNIQHLLVLVTD